MTYSISSATFYCSSLCGTVDNWRRIMKCKGLIAVNIRIAVFWVMTPCSLVGGYQRFGETSILDFQGRLEHAGSRVFTNA